MLTTFHHDSTVDDDLVLILGLLPFRQFFVKSTSRLETLANEILEDLRTKIVLVKCFA